MNEHIKEYCEKFIESVESPHFALLIKGDWGIGKTFFIDNLINKYDPENEDNKSGISRNDIIKISLFGVKTTDDIDLKIYQAIHPILSSKTMKIAGAILRSAVKFGTCLELTGDGKNNLTFSSDGLNELIDNKKEKNISKKLLIVDDLERALIEPCEIFGYFSEIINESDTKVIFIGNEQKIFDCNDEKKDEYFKIKEKTIGMEFQIEPAFDEAIDYFVNEIQFETELIDIIKDKIKNISVKIKCRNLRTIRQSLFNLKIFFDVIDDFEIEDKKLCIEVYLILFIQKNLKFIESTDDIPNVLTIYFTMGISFDEYKKITPNYKKSLDYSYPMINGYIPILNYWKSIIFDGNYESEFLKNEYKTEKEQILDSLSKDQKTLFKLIHNWRKMDKTSFQDYLLILESEFSNGKYLHIGEILHYADLMLGFTEWKLIPNSVDNIQQKIEDFLVVFKSRIIFENEWGQLQFGYGGFAFNFNIPGFEHIYNFIRQLNKEFVIEKIKNDINSEIDLLESNISSFHNNIIFANGSNKYFGYPIMSFIDIDKFYKKLCSLSIENQFLVVECFEERYGKKYDNEPLNQNYSSDYINLKKLSEMYKSDEKDFLFNPIEYGRHLVTTKWNDLVSYFEKKNPSLKSDNME